MAATSPSDMAPTRVTLSLCIATYNRAAFIGATLQALVEQMPADGSVEVMVVDGASPDRTADVVTSFARRHPTVRYMQEETNSGVDRDFDKAVGYARGDYCWLMSDDDLLAPGALQRVLEELTGEPDLLVINAEIRNADLSTVLRPRFLELSADRSYGAGDRDAFFAEVADYLSFIGGVVIRRSVWMQRDRASYYGTLFIHVGVIFQPPALRTVKLITDPLVVIRYGNALWSARGFEVWTFKWPTLVWSFADVPAAIRHRVVAPRPWTRLRRLVFYRAIGAYSYEEYRKFVAGRGLRAAPALAVALLPAALANTLSALYWFVVNRRARAGLYDLARSRHATALTRLVARTLHIPTA